MRRCACCTRTSVARKRCTAGYAAPFQSNPKGCDGWSCRQLGGSNTVRVVHVSLKPERVRGACRASAAAHSARHARYAGVRYCLIQTDRHAKSCVVFYTHIIETRWLKNCPRDSCYLLLEICSSGAWNEQKCCPSFAICIASARACEQAAQQRISASRLGCYSTKYVLCLILS